jgi:hypothetical protein
MLRRIIAAAVVTVLAGSSALAQTSPAPAPAPSAPAAAAPAPAAVAPAPLPDAEGLLILIRSHVYAVSLANKANNYTVLRAMAGKAFRENNSEEGLSKLFEGLRNANLDFAPVLIVAPLVTEGPVMVENKLRLGGFFPTRPIEIPFQLLLEAEDGRWKMHSISVGARPAVVTSAVSAPAPTVAAPAADPKKAQPKK